MSEPTIPQKPPFEKTELYADIIHTYYHRLAHLNAKTQVKAMYLDSDAPDFRARRDKLYADAEEATGTIEGEYFRLLEQTRQRYEEGEL